MTNVIKTENKKVASMFPKLYFCIKDNISFNEKSPIGTINKYINLFVNEIKSFETDGFDALELGLSSSNTKYFSGSNNQGIQNNTIPTKFLQKVAGMLSNDFKRKVSENKVQESILWKQYDFNKTDKITINEVEEWFTDNFNSPVSTVTYKMLISEDYSDEFRNYILLLASLLGNMLDNIKEDLNGLNEALKNNKVYVNSYDGYTSSLPDPNKAEVVDRILNFNDSYNSNDDIQQLYSNLEFFYRYSVYCKTDEKINGYDKGENIKRITDLGTIPQLVQYFTFFEAVNIYLSVSGEPFDMIDDLFRYRFMLATNNPIIQRDELFPLIGSYNNICCLYKNWIRAIGRKEQTYFFEPNEIYFGEFNLPDSYKAYKFVKTDFESQDFIRNDKQLFIELKCLNSFCVHDESSSINSYLEFEKAENTINITSFSYNSEYADKSLRMLPILILAVQWIELIDTSYKSITIKKELVNEINLDFFINAGFRELVEEPECLVWNNLLHGSD